MLFRRYEMRRRGVVRRRQPTNQIRRIHRLVRRRRLLLNLRINQERRVKFSRVVIVAVAVVGVQGKVEICLVRVEKTRKVLFALDRLVTGRLLQLVHKARFEGLRVLLILRESLLLRGR